MTHLQTPQALSSGDRVAAVSLSWGGPGTYPEQFKRGCEQLERTFGIQVDAMPNALKSADWLWRNPEARADDLMQAFEDNRYRAIISTIGGDDSIRILPWLKLDVIQANPKVFLGYSDSTITHMACLKAGVRSYYGPTIMAGFGEPGGLFPFMVDTVRKTLFEPTANWALPANKGLWSTEALPWSGLEANQQRPRESPLSWRWLQGQGEINGRLIGGCLDVLDMLRGTDFWPADDLWQGAVLFLETSEQAPPPSTLQYFLRTLAAMGLLQKINGLLFGRPGGCRPESFLAYDDVILKVIRDEAGLDIPIITHLDFGHTDPMWVLPQGGLIEIDCEQQRLVLAEPATRPRQ